MNAKAIYFLYRLAQLAAVPFILLYFLHRVIRDGRYLGRFGERLGFLPHRYKQTAAGAVWLHAVSVGEVLSSAVLLRRLRETFPMSPLFVSCTTLAGRAVAEEKLADLADGVFYAPVDYCSAVRRVLRTLRPSVLIVLETEIWPNLYREAKRAGCGLVIANGRISDRAAPRYLRFRWFFRQVLRWPDAILAQNEASRSRYLALGALPGRVTVGGNLKYDFDPGQTHIPGAVQSLLDRLRPEAVWIAASTMPPADAGDVDEDDAVLGAFQELAAKHSGLLMILAPRRPERFHEAAAKLAQSGISYARRTRLETEGPELRLPGVLLLDTIGELSGLFAAADVVFMGGTLARRGGHNILEPALFAKPVILGPHMENFPDIGADFSDAGACVRIRRPEELHAAVGALLKEDHYRACLGERARRLAEERRGTTTTAARQVAAAYSIAVPRFRPVLPVFQVLWLLSMLWRLGGWVKRRIDLSRREKLGTPVVSVGNLSMGGSGKTPFVLWLADRLRVEGYRPAILTRGYRRHGPERETVLEAGAEAPVDLTGDEGQILLRSGVGPLGIGARRASVGRLLEERFQPDVFVMDDGFQHARLERDLDIVLVDAMDPLGEVVPLGRLREPPGALARAGLFVVTRTERGLDYEGIRREIRGRNRKAPVFLSRVVPLWWEELGTGQRWRPGELPFSQVAAFCGLANPSSFWQTVLRLGYRPLRRWDVPDHHRYKVLELRRLVAQARSAGAEVLLTTEKDVVNLGAQGAAWAKPLRVFWLKIGLEVDDERRLIDIVQNCLAAAPRPARKQG